MSQGKLKIVQTNVDSAVPSKGIVKAIVAANEGTANRTDEEALKSIFTCLSGNKKEVLSLLVMEYGTGASFKTSCTNIYRVTGIHSGSVQRILAKFAEQGYLAKKRYREGVFQGFEIHLKPVCNYFHNFILNETILVRTTVPAFSPSKVNSINKTTYSEDAQRILALKDEDIATQYPALSGVGFGTDQLRQIVEHRNKLDISLAGVLHSLEYAEYMLKKDLFKDKFGGAIKNYNGFIFKILRDSGFISKPQGFKTAQECVAGEAEERLRAIKDAKKREMNALHEGWLLELSSEEREELLNDKIGPEDVFLRNYWKSNVLNQEGGGNDRA